MPWHTTSLTEAQTVFGNRGNRRWRNRFLHIDDVVVAQAIQFIGGHARLHMRYQHRQHLGGQLAGSA
jgi:hypothetical protein